MLLEGPASDMYTVLLPIIEGPFRASLQGSDNNELALCLESGDPNVQTLHGLHALYINAGSDPFQVITDAVRWVSSPFYSSIQCFDTFSANCKGWLD
jgi:raffinose synthase